MQRIKIPEGARAIIEKLQNAGFEAYIVGGCVRDNVLGLSPHDWDICTSAMPETAIKLLEKYKIIPTGLKHGTVTVFPGDQTDGYEVTTFRKDGEYKDNRHPESVEFVKSLREDLARRDFTINAMAYSDATGIVDYFGGVEDLHNKRISCVGDPDERFREDALRILRALRFSSTYGFSVSEKTADAIHRNGPLLANIAAERIQSELEKILVGQNVLSILLSYPDIFVQIIPELGPCVGFSQNNPYHVYTVYDHIAHAVANYEGTDLSVKVALLLHDIGKPLCYSEDARGGHFYGHAVPGADMTKEIVKRLKFDRKTQAEVEELVLYHDSVIEPTPKTVKRWLNKIGEDQFRRLLEVKKADILAHAKETQADRLKRHEMLYCILNDVIVESQCFSLKDLDISGNDIIALGFQEGKIIGKILNSLLEKVINGEIKNKRDALIKEICNT